MSILGWSHVLALANNALINMDVQCPLWCADSKSARSALRRSIVVSYGSSILSFWGTSITDCHSGCTSFLRAPSEPQMEVFNCGWSHLSEQSLKEKLDTWLPGLPLARWSIKLKVPSWHSPEFLGDQLASGDEGNTAGPGPKEEHPANAASSAHALEEFAPREGSETRDAGRGIVSEWSQTWKSKQWRVVCSGLFSCAEKVFGVYL